VGCRLGSRGPSRGHLGFLPRFIFVRRAAPEHRRRARSRRILTMVAGFALGRRSPAAVAAAITALLLLVHVALVQPAWQDQHPPKKHTTKTKKRSDGRRCRLGKAIRYSGEGASLARVACTGRGPRQRRGLERYVASVRPGLCCSASGQGFEWPTCATLGLDDEVAGFWHDVR